MRPSPLAPATSTSRLETCTSAGFCGFDVDYTAFHIQEIDPAPNFDAADFAVDLKLYHCRVDGGRQVVHVPCHERLSSSGKFLWVFFIPKFGLFAFVYPRLAKQGHNTGGWQISASVHFLGEVFTERIGPPVFTVTTRREAVKTGTVCAI